MYRTTSEISTYQGISTDFNDKRTGFHGNCEPLVFDNPKEDAAVDIDVCSEDAIVQICASTFASKRQLMEKRGPGRPKKKLREEDWRQKLYNAADSESYSSFGVWESYEAAIINYHTADENSRAPILTKEFHATYTAERRF